MIFCIVIHQALGGGGVSCMKEALNMDLLGVL